MQKTPKNHPKTTIVRFVNAKEESSLWRPQKVKRARFPPLSSTPWLGLPCLWYNKRGPGGLLGRTLARPTKVNRLPAPRPVEFQLQCQSQPRATWAALFLWLLLPHGLTPFPKKILLGIAWGVLPRPVFTRPRGLIIPYGVALASGPGPCRAAALRSTPIPRCGCTPKKNPPWRCSCHQVIKLRWFIAAVSDVGLAMVRPPSAVPWPRVCAALQFLLRQKEESSAGIRAGSCGYSAGSSLDYPHV
jgi:hypothetical protein